MADIAVKWSKFWQSFWVNEGYVRVFSEGLKNTLIIAVAGLVIGIIIGTIIAAFKVMPKYKVFPRIVDGIFSVYVGFFRGTPIVVQLLLAYFVIFPMMGVNIGSLNTSILVFGLNSGAYISEMMRAGIQSVDIGQMEAGRAVGLSYSVTMMKIIVPQAVKNILPTLGNEFIALIKETLVASFVAVVDLYKVFTEIGTSNYEYLIPYLFMAIIYIVLVMFITLLIKLMERGLARSDRRN
ncbi:MAG: amino acid ABC transporter permease [Clostridia bacterium]|nr:amino acid ABC transporter permease [Clostridia bacterium]